MVIGSPDWLFNNVFIKKWKIDGKARSSMSDDLAHGRKTEIDYINGELVQLAHLLHVGRARIVRTEHSHAIRSAQRYAALAADAAIRPFDAAIARRHLRLGEHHQAALETARAHDLLEFLARGGIERIMDPHHDVRRRNQLAEAIARQGGNLGKRLARDQRRRQFSGDRDRDFDGLAFEPRLDRAQRFTGCSNAVGDALERTSNAPVALDLGVGLRLGITAPLRGCLSLG